MKRLEKLKRVLYFAPIPLIKILPSWNADPKRVVSGMIEYALFFIGALALVFVIYGGVLYITSGGDSEKTTKARNTLMYAVLGVIVVVISYAIVKWASTAPGTI